MYIVRVLSRFLWLDASDQSSGAPEHLGRDDLFMDYVAWCTGLVQWCTRPLTHNICF
jgi:hypothetical protein